jgi:two-component system, chemotaxis family, chemotaxis protein CheY
MKVLVVDDSGVMRKIIIRSLNALSVTDTAEAGNGVEGLEKYAAAGPFDLVITDWNMPEMNGLQFVQTLRSQGATLPILMVTTESEKASVLQAIQAGVTDYLVKPFETEQLQDKLDKYVCV